MAPIQFINRETGAIETEQVYGEYFIHLLYGTSFLSRIFGAPQAFLMSRLSFLSAFYGYLQTLPSSAKKIKPFITKFQVDASEFASPISEFGSFNAFFTRKLLPSARPIDPNPHHLIIPADGRYLFFTNIEKSGDFFIKGKKFDLAKLLKCATLAAEYRRGSMAIARLCPTDYHRYHFPSDCVPGAARLINGPLSSVNPLAIKKSLQIFWENKRTLCELDTPLFGKILFLEIGALCVGTIHQTYSPLKKYQKGEEKGYFSFGGSTLILLFPPNSIRFDADLLTATAKGFEIKCLMGQSMGTSRSSV